MKAGGGTTMETMKVFDRCNPGMRHLDTALEDWTEALELSNDTYGRWYVGATDQHGQTPAIDKWLQEQGCEVGETVLIHISW